MFRNDAAIYGYDQLLAQFAILLSRARSLHTTNPADTLFIKAAVIGFSLHVDIHEWGIEEYDYVNGFLTEDPKPVDLNRVKGGDEGYTAFLCLGLGSLCGLHVAAQIDLDGVARGEWALVAFLSAHNEGICRQYSEFIRSKA